MYFKWKNEYSVNVAEIDEQHKKLFQIGSRINDLAFADDEYDHYDEILSILKELKDYTQYHFNHEEKMMEKYGYERKDSHKFEHYFVIKKIEKFENSDIDENQKDTVVDLVAFISDWISSHILKEDMQYKNFFNSKGIC
jgi:hemerythrin